MTRIYKAVFLLAALGWAAGLAAMPAAAQLSEPTPGWEPGQPFVVTIHGARGTPLMVVHVGRIPLASEARVALILPDLGDTGLAYAVSTRGDPLARRMVPPGFPGSDMMKKEQETVGRIHTAVILSPANPALGKEPGTWLAVGAQGLDHWLVPEVPDDMGTMGCVFGGYPAPGGVSFQPADGALGLDPGAVDRTMDGGRALGVPNVHGPPGGGPPDVIPPDDLYGGDRRDIDPLTPADGVFTKGHAPPGFVDGVLSGTGDRATGVDPGGSGPPEAASANCTFGGYHVPGAGTLIDKGTVVGIAKDAPRRSLDPGGRPPGRRWVKPERPAPAPHVRRPVETVPIVGPLLGPLDGGATIGHARFILGVGPNGLTLGTSTG